MSIVKRFFGFDDEAFKITFIKSQGWKDSSMDITSGDLDEVICTEVPSYSDESNQVEINKIGVTKRNPLKFIGAGAGKVMFKLLMGPKITNAYGDSLFRATLGELVLPVDGSQASVKVLNCTLGDAYTISGPVGATDFDDIYDPEKQVQLISIHDAVTDEMLDIDVIIGIVGSDARVAGQLDSGLDLTGSTSYNIKALTWVDIDQVPRQMLDFVIQRASEFDFANDPEFDGAYDGSEIVLMKNAQGNVTFDLPLQEQPTVEFEFMTDDHQLVDPAPETLPLTITVGGTGAGSLDVNVLIKGKASFEASVTATSGLTADLTATAIAAAIDALTDFSAAAVGPVVTVTSSTKTFVDLVVSTADAFSFAVAKNEEDYWEKYSMPNASRIPNVAFDTGATGTVNSEVQVALSGTTLNSGTRARLTVNGRIYDYIVAPADTLDLIATGLAALIDADEFTDYKGDVLREINFNATASTSNVDIVATNYHTSLEVTFDVIDPIPAGDLAGAINVVETTEAEQYADDEANFFKLSKMMMGDAGVNMFPFCEVGKISLAFKRDIADINSVCSDTGRKGWNNTSFTITLEVETTDIDAKRVFRAFEYYKKNRTFALSGLDKATGFGFFFPACRFETFEKSAMDNLQGHKMMINVNFDPNKKPLLSLHQALEY